MKAIMMTVHHRDRNVPVYYDETRSPDSIACAWRMRNPESCYTGIVYMNNETGAITYPEGAVIPAQTEKDREMLPQFLIVGVPHISSSFLAKIENYLESEYNLRNKPADVDWKFTEADIKDKDRLERMIEKEALAIYNSESGRRDRDLETIKFFVRQGKVAELWLIENAGYEEADKKYHDLKKDGEYSEVKAYNIPHKNMPFVQKDLKRLKSATWNISKWYILFKCTDGVYELIEKIAI